MDRRRMLKLTSIALAGGSLHTNAARARAAGKSRRALGLAVGLAAIAAPALHSLTDVMEWAHGGFTDVQLWLNLLAFLPMPWLLLGIHSLREPRPGGAGLAGAVLYGTAFVYFTYTTVYALAEHVPTYEALWGRLGHVYTLFGGLMVCGGALFALSALRGAWRQADAFHAAKRSITMGREAE